MTEEPLAAQPDSIARNAFFSLAAQIVTSVATAALTIYLVRALGPKSFGTFAIAIGISTLLLLPADFGISNSAARFIAEHRGQWLSIGGLLRAAVRYKALALIVVAGALIGLAEPIADAYHTPALAWPLRGVAIALVGQSLMMLFTASFVALGRVSQSLRTIAAESVVEAGASAGLVLLGAGVTGAAFGRAIGYAFGATVGGLLALRLVGMRNVREGRVPPGGGRRLVGYATALMVIDGAYALLGSSGVLLIGAFLNARQVGLFSPATRLIVFLHYPGYAISNGVAPRLARGEDGEPDVRALQLGLRYLVLFQTVLVAPTVVWAHPLTRLALGSGYGRTADVLAALAPYTFLSGFAPLISLSVNYLGEARRRVPVALITLALSLGLNAVLIPNVGIVGTSIATDVAYGFYVVGHFWICRRLVGLPLRPLVADLARCLVAAGGMAAVLAAFGTHRLSVATIVFGGLLSLVAYCGLLLVTRAVTPGELRDARDFVRRRLRRRAPVEAS